MLAGSLIFVLLRSDLLFWPLCSGHFSGDIKRVQHILDSKPKQCNKLSPEGATPLMIAAMIGRGDIAELLVQRGADINMQDAKSGWTALMQATFHRRKDLVKFLVDAGADVNVQANDGCKALDLALVIVMNENDKANNELISLLAAVTMPTNGTKPSQGHMTKSSTWSIKTSMSQLSQDSPRNGLKVRTLRWAVTPIHLFTIKARRHYDRSVTVAVHGIMTSHPVTAHVRPPSGILPMWCACEHAVTGCLVRFYNSM